MIKDLTTLHKNLAYVVGIIVEIDACRIDGTFVVSIPEVTEQVLRVLRIDRTFQAEDFEAIYKHMPVFVDEAIKN